MVYLSWMFVPSRETGVVTLRSTAQCVLKVIASRQHLRWALCTSEWCGLRVPVLLLSDCVILSMLFNPVAPHLFGTRDWFHGRQFFHGTVWGCGDGFGMIQVHYIYCALYFCYYCIVICNEIIIQLTIMKNQWEPWACFHLLLTDRGFFFFKKRYSFFIYLFIIYLFLAVLGLRFCARAFSSCGKQGPLFIVVRGPLTIAASLVAEHRLQMRRVSSCGSWA